jgi:hypothetical protein
MCLKNTQKINQIKIAKFSGMLVWEDDSEINKFF